MASKQAAKIASNVVPVSKVRQSLSLDRPSPTEYETPPSKSL